MDGYLDYALTLPSTRAVALFMETSRDPAGLRQALQRAAERDIPVVCLKVGRSLRSRRFVATHAGALAGADMAYDALFDASGVLTRTSGPVNRPHAIEQAGVPDLRCYRRLWVNGGPSRAGVADSST
jgi:acyl-CoA synthetase (NDP forming)